MLFVNCYCFSLKLHTVDKMLLDNIVTVVDYGLYVCVFFSFFCVAIVLFSVYSTVIGKLKIIIHDPYKST